MLAYKGSEVEWRVHCNHRPKVRVCPLDWLMGESRITLRLGVRGSYKSIGNSFVGDTIAFQDQVDEKNYPIVDCDSLGCSYDRVFHSISHAIPADHLKY